MHYLHKILVHIPEVTNQAESADNKDTLVQKIRNYAENETESFYQKAFDWRETDSAGRWSNEYPVNVIFAADDIERFVTELTTAMENQNAESHICLTQLKESVGTNLEEIVQGLQGRYSCDDSKNGFSFMTPYYFYCLAAQLYGEYRSDSYFYNTLEHSSCIFQKDIDQIRENPEYWALVMFDYHN